MAAKIYVSDTAIEERGRYCAKGDLVTSVMTVTDPPLLFGFERSPPGASDRDCPTVVRASRSFLISRDVEVYLLSCIVS